jgi:hypothetical protein
MSTPIDYLCVCEEEWCWCTQRVPQTDMACHLCLTGHHVMFWNGLSVPDPKKHPGVADTGPRFTALLDDDYRPGDMAHPYEPKHIDLRKELRDPDHWVGAFLILVTMWVAVVLILTSEG